MIFTKWGGFIVNEETTDNIEMDKIGNVYTIEAWVDGGSEPEQSFPRQAVAP